MLENSTQTRFLGARFHAAETRFSAVFTACIFSAIALIAAPSAGRAEPENKLPKVLMVEIVDVTPNDSDLYRAIRAQLSAASLILERLALENAQAFAADPLHGLSRLAAENHATMVFWIEDEGATCTVFFYIADADGGHIDTRILNIPSGNRSGRFETIANAAASVIEENINSFKTLSAMHAQPSTHVPQAPKAVEPRSSSIRVELFAVYAGSYFVSSQVTHGVRMGFGILPTDRVAVSISYTQNLPAEWENERYRLTLTPRNIEVSAAGRMLVGPVDVRLGIAWSVDLRSYSTASFSSSVSARSGKFQAIQSLVPFVTATWTFLDRFGIVTGVGANLAVNERIYKISRDDGTEVAVLRPFIAKLTYQLGLVVHL
jgi:hypothetical protein